MKKNRFGFTPLEIIRKIKKRRGMISLTGFTLLELLIAVTIFSIIAIVLYSSFYVGIRILRRAEEAMELHQDLRLVMEELSLDLRNSLLCPLYQEVRKTPVTEEEEEKPVYFFLGDRDRFTFVTLRSVLRGKKLRREICNVTYYLQEKKLTRTVKYQGGGFVTRPGEEEGLLKNIEEMEIQYSFQGEEEDSEPIWLNNWDQEEKIPLGVKIKLKLKGLGELREFTKTVLIPVGSLGVLEEEKL